MKGIYWSWTQPSIFFDETLLRVGKAKQRKWRKKIAKSMEFHILMYLRLMRLPSKKFFCGFEPAKMHWAFLRATNAFQDESWDLSNFICYEGSCISLKYISNKHGKKVNASQVLVKEEKQVFSLLLRIWLKNYMLA